MGTAAKHGRRALVDMVRECVEAVNDQGAALDKTRAEVAKAQNALVDQVKVDLAGVERRGQSNAFDRMKQAQEHADGADKTLATTLRAEVIGRTARAFALAGQTTFWQRLRWLFTGKLPA